VKHLHHDRPFYGIQAPGLVGIVPGHNSIEEMAAYYVDEILTIQPLTSLPYFLGGYSFGGLVAFEMARQLQARGGSVALLALLDSYPSKQEVSAEAHTEIVKDYTRSMLRLTESLERYREKKVLISYNDLSRLQPDEQLAYVLDRLKEGQIVPDDMDISQFRRYREVDESHNSCLQRYQPQPYSGRITLFRSADTEADPSLWLPFASEPVEVHAVPGHHMVMLDEPYVQSLAVQLQQCLDKLTFKLN
jgi:thioesterase domain-containing protein